MPIADSESIVSSDETKPGKKDHSPPCREGRGLGDSLPSPQSCMPPPYRWDGWGTADGAA